MGPRRRRAREWDLAQVFYTSQRLGYPAREDVEGFGAAYGWDPREWPGLATLVAIREVSGLGTYIRNALAQPFARRELAMRIGTLQASDRSARWNRPVLANTREALEGQLRISRGAAFRLRSRTRSRLRAARKRAAREAAGDARDQELDRALRPTPA